MALIDRYLTTLVNASGSDLHLYSGRMPFVRIHGVISPIAGEPTFASDDILALLREIMPEDNLTQLTQEWDTDCAYEIPGLARFRVNGFRDMSGYGAVLRVIPERIPTFEELTRRTDRKSTRLNSSH